MKTEAENYLARIRSLEVEIEKLPRGSIGRKKVRGHVYYYLRWQEDRKRKEKYIPADRLVLVQSQIDRRKELQAELKSLRNQFAAAGMVYDASGSGMGSLNQPMKTAPVPTPDPEYRMNVLTGDSLRVYAEAAASYKKRECYSVLNQYLYGPRTDRVFVLYGLRRTGKTTMIRQVLLEMSDAEFLKAAFIQVTPRDTMADLNADLKQLRREEFLYIFIDEVTFLEDFIEGAALFSDIFAAGGMKIILSGTDSLGFLFAEDEQLYDRCVLLHTTFIPYREFESVLGIIGIDEYIRYGGTMSISGHDYNRTSTFATKKSTDEYIDSSIARNIQHSLRCYQYEGHFRALQELYEKKELTSAINRVVEDMNHRFTVETLTREFKSGDLALSAQNLRRDRTHPTDILDKVDVASVTGRMAELLEIRNRKDQKVKIGAIHAEEIHEYLDLLDLTVDLDIVDMKNLNNRKTRTAIAQPGLRYSQVDALIESLLQDAEFAELSLEERNYVLNRIRTEVMGRMMEDIILLETRKAFPARQVFKCQFAIGEFDMVVFDPEGAWCEIFEIKHSAERHPSQYRYLADEEKCAQTRFRFGMIRRKTVLYRGPDGEENGIQYRNIEGYLRSLDLADGVLSH